MFQYKGIPHARLNSDTFGFFFADRKYYCHHGESERFKYQKCGGRGQQQADGHQRHRSRTHRQLRSLRAILNLAFKLWHTANKGLVRIQYKCLVPIYVLPEIILCSLLIFKNRIIYNVLSPNSYTHNICERCIYFQDCLSILLKLWHTANKRLVRIQYNCLVPIYVFTEIILCSRFQWFATHFAEPSCFMWGQAHIRPKNKNILKKKFSLQYPLSYFDVVFFKMLFV